MKKYLTDKEKEERMNYLTIHKCKNEDERKELKELCDWYFKDTPVLTMSFSLTEEDLRVTMERDVELSAVAGAVKNQHHKKPSVEIRGQDKTGACVQHRPLHDFREIY